MAARAHAAIAIALMTSVASLALIAPGAAIAGEAERTQAELVFQKAVEKLAQGAAEEACALFEESDHIDPQPGTEYELAKCYATIGRHASAWSRFRAVAEKLDAKGEHEKAEKVRRLVTDTIEPKLARLTITVPDRAARAPGLDVKRDGVPIGKAMWGAATPVDPGAHRVRVVAPNKVPWETTASVKPSASVTIIVPELSDEAAIALPKPTPLAPLQRPPEPAPAWPTQRKVAIAAGALGAAGIALGVGFGLAALSKASTWKTLVDEGCNNPARDCKSTALIQTIQGIERDRSTFATGSTAGFIAGGAAIAGGLVLWVAAPRRDGASLSLAPSFTAGNTGFFARGSF